MERTILKLAFNRQHGYNQSESDSQPLISLSAHYRRFLTSFTEPAICVAKSLFLCESTVPARVATPLVVFTSICSTLRSGSARIADLTLVVITLSLMA